VRFDDSPTFCREAQGSAFPREGTGNTCRCAARQMGVLAKYTGKDHRDFHTAPRCRIATWCQLSEREVKGRAMWRAPPHRREDDKAVIVTARGLPLLYLAPDGEMST